MNSYLILLLFHTLIIGPLFIYIGINKEKINLKIYDILYYISIPLILYHIYKINQHISWVNYIHIFIIGPLLYFIGKNKKSSPNYYYEILLLLGFGIFGYNGYKLLKYKEMII